MDSIRITDLKVPTRIGVTPEERKADQTILVSVEMKTSTKKAGGTDMLGDTIDYHAVAEAIKEIGRQERKTIEKFAEDTAQMILGDFGASSVTVTIVKHILPDTKDVSVTITRP